MPNRRVRRRHALRVTRGAAVSPNDLALPPRLPVLTSRAELRPTGEELGRCGDESGWPYAPQGMLPAPRHNPSPESASSESIAVMYTAMSASRVRPVSGRLDSSHSVATCRHLSTDTFRAELEQGGRAAPRATIQESAHGRLRRIHMPDHQPPSRGPGCPASSGTQDGRAPACPGSTGVVDRRGARPPSRMSSARVDGWRQSCAPRPRPVRPAR